MAMIERRTMAKVRADRNQVGAFQTFQVTGWSWWKEI